MITRSPIKRILLLLAIFLFAFQVKQPVINTNTTVKKLLKEKEDFIKSNLYPQAVETLMDLKTYYVQQEQWSEAVACYNEAAVLSDMISYEDKGKYTKQALTLSKKYLSTNHLERAKALKQQGEIYMIYDSLDSAILCLNDAALLFEHHQEWKEKAWSIFTIAICYYYKDNIDSAKIYLTKTENIAKKYQLSTEIFSATAQLFGIIYYDEESDYEQAIRVTNNALKLLLASDEVIDSFVIGDIYHNLATYHHEKGNLRRASYYYKLSLKIHDNLGGQGIEKVDILYHYGGTQALLGNEDLAIQIYHKALNLTNRIEEKNEYPPKLYRRLSRSYDKKGQLDSALYYVNKALDLFVDENNHAALVLKAELLYKNKENSKAIALVENITYPKPSFDIELLKVKIHAKNLLGKLYTSTQNYDAALRSYQTALMLNCLNFHDTLNLFSLPAIEEHYLTDRLIQTLKNKASTLKAMNTSESLQAAFQTNQLAIQYAEKMRQNFVFEEAKININRQMTTLYKEAIETAYRLYESTNDPTFLEKAFVIAEKQKGILLLESLIDAKGKEYYQVPEHLLEKEQQLKTDIAFYKQKMLEVDQKKDTTTYELYQDYYTNFNIEFGNLKDTLRTYYKTYFDLEYQTSLASVQLIQRDLIEENQAFIQYLTIDSLFYVFVIEKEKSHFVTLPKGKEQNRMLRALQKILHNSNAVKTTEKETFETFTTLAYQGYQQVLEPLTNRLSSDVTKLIIVPDKFLNYLPFEALLEEAVASLEIDYMRLPYLLRKYQFHYGYSGTLLLENQKQYDRIQTNDKVLAFAPPYKQEEMPIALRGEEDNVRGNVVNPLKGTAKEIEEISTYFKGKFDSSESATKENFQKEASDYGILHLAMHGTPSLDAPDYAHLIFTNVGNDTAKNNLLHHYEITALKTNAQLAVLSACETGVGKELEGEGIMSLGRGFMYAGIPSVVMSLWKMNDQSTSELMPLFYKNLTEGMRKDEALHHAKLEYLDNAIAERAYPFYWAGFVSLGDAHPIKKAETSFEVWLLSGIGILFALLLGVRFLKFRQ